MPDLTIQPWEDPMVDRFGHDPRSAYVERFWLAILGPSTVWLLRRIADRLDQHPDGFTLDLTEMAGELGVGTRHGKKSPFLRSIERSCRFDAARFVGPTDLAVRRAIPPLKPAQAAHLPRKLREELNDWEDSAPKAPDPANARQRARQLALSLLQLGEDRATTERQLRRWRFHPAVANEAVRWAFARRS